MRLLTLLALTVSLPLHLLAADAALQPASVFSDHLVLQRDRPVPVWGVAAPGAKITVTLGSTSAAAVADAQGRWRVAIGPFPANATPATLSMTSDRQERCDLQDVLIGEVWLGSGQSNMQLSARSFINADAKIGSQGDRNLQALVQAGPYPQVRLLSAMNGQGGPVERLAWVPATVENLGAFSAHLGTMGVTLSKRLQMPVGLMVAAVGGSPSTRWLPAEALETDPGCRDLLAKARATFKPEQEQAKYQQDLTKYEQDLAAWNQLSEAERKDKKAPSKPGLPSAPGTGRWPVGDLYQKVLTPLIGYGIRGVLWDQGESGAFIRGLDQATVMAALFSTWRTAWQQGDLPFVIVQKPSGGGPAFDPADPIFGWAADPFKPLPAAPSGNGKGREEMQRIAAATPGVTLVPTSDLGGGLHPSNKFGYGSRAAQVILGAIYGQAVAWSGPTLREATVEGPRIRVQFRHVGQGLVARHADRLQGFAIAGENRKFVWAEAAIDGETVVVSSPAMAQPRYVRYAYDSQIPWANLFNRDGLPAQSFRTDP